MIAFLAIAWKFIVGAIAGFILAWGIQSLIINDIESAQGAAIESQKMADIAQCEKLKQVTMDVSHDYQTQLAALNDQLNTYKLRKPAKCIMPASQSSTGCDATAAKGQLPGGDGVDTGFLIDFAGRCEKTRLQLLSCQKFVGDERAKVQ